MKIDDDNNNEENSNSENQYKYEISTGNNYPLLNLVPKGSEIYHRLILKATLAKNMDELAIK